MPLSIRIIVHDQHQCSFSQVHIKATMKCFFIRFGQLKFNSNIGQHVQLHPLVSCMNVWRARCVLAVQVQSDAVDVECALVMHVRCIVWEQLRLQYMHQYVWIMIRINWFKKTTQQVRATKHIWQLDLTRRCSFSPLLLMTDETRTHDKYT